MAKLYAYNTSATPVKKRYAMIGSTATQVKKKYAMIGSTATLVYSAWEDGALFNDGQIWEEAGDIKVTGSNIGNTTVTVADDGIYTWVYPENGKNAVAYIGFSNPIDMTNYNTLYALVDYDFEPWSVAKGLQVGTSFGKLDKGYSKDLNHDSRYDGAPVNSGRQKIISVDISGLSGSYYVTWYGANSSGGIWMKYYKIWME